MKALTILLVQVLFFPRHVFTIMIASNVAKFMPKSCISVIVVMLIKVKKAVTVGESCICNNTRSRWACLRVHNGFSFTRQKRITFFRFLAGFVGVGWLPIFWPIGWHYNSSRIVWSCAGGGQSIRSSQGWGCKWSMRGTLGQLLWERLSLMSI